jgi:hypothetical protein
MLALLGAHHILHVSRIRVKDTVLCFMYGTDPVFLDLLGVTRYCVRAHCDINYFAFHMSVLFIGVNFSHLNSPDTNTGVTPLQVAIKTGNFRTIQVLLNAKASREHLDNEANSVFHYAASTTKEIISVNICHIKYYLLGMEQECDGCVSACVLFARLPFRSSIFFV